MWTHSRKNILTTQMKRLAKRHGSTIVRKINFCGMTKQQFIELAVLLVDTLSGTDFAPLNDRKNFYVVKFSKHYPNDRRKQLARAQKFFTRKSKSARKQN